jgi:hypothetical protein
VDRPAIWRAFLFGIFCIPAFAANDTDAHGLWVWKSATLLNAPRAPETLRDFCQTEGINEVYVSVSASDEASEEGHLGRLIALLHRADIRAEALLSSENADEPGKHREKLLGRVRGVIDFNRKHPADRFDGIHLDIEPQQRPENKGPGNLRFLPGLVDAYREVRALAERAKLTVNADIQNKLLKGGLAQRRMLFTSLPRLTLMLYELSSPQDGESTEAKLEKLRTASRKFLDMAYENLDGNNLARMAIALRTPDYGDKLPAMLKELDRANRSNPHYRGWAWHSYNDARTKDR